MLMNFDTDLRQQIDVTELVKMFDSNELDPHEFMEAESRGLLSRLSCLTFTSDWALTPLALTAVKNRLYVWADLDPDDLHVADVISDASAKVEMLQWVAQKFWRLEQFWVSNPEFLDKYDGPLEMLASFFWDGDVPVGTDGLYAKGRAVFIDFGYED